MEDSLLAGAGWAWVGCSGAEVGETSAGLDPQELTMPVSKATRQNTSWFLKFNLIDIPKIRVP
jgi:hypothetical protein